MTLGPFSGRLLFLEDPDGEGSWTPPGGGDKVRGCNVVNLAGFSLLMHGVSGMPPSPGKGGGGTVVNRFVFGVHLSASRLARLSNMGFPLPSTSERTAVSKYGIPWTPSEFLAEAHRRPHPAQSHYLPECLEQAIAREASEGLHSIAKDTSGKCLKANSC